MSYMSEMHYEVTCERGERMAERQHRRSGYHTAHPPTTQTSDGKPVDWLIDYGAKTVTVWVAGVALGTFPNRAAAKAALKLVDVAVTYVPRKRVKESW